MKQGDSWEPEHRKEAEKISARNFTRSTRRASTNEHHKSAITDHVRQNNHIMNWGASEIVEQEIKATSLRDGSRTAYVLDRKLLYYEQGRGSP